MFMSLSSCYYFSYIWLCYLAIHILLVTFILWSCIVLFLLWEKKIKIFSSSNVLALKSPFFFSSYLITFILGILRFTTLITARTSYSLTILPPLLSFVMLHLFYVFVNPQDDPVNCIKLELLIFTYVAHSNILPSCISALLSWVTVLVVQPLFLVVWVYWVWNILSINHSIYLPLTIFLSLLFFSAFIKLLCSGFCF